MLMYKLNECSITTSNSTKHIQNVFDSKNLENPGEKYGYGNFSVEYLSLATKSVENVDEKSLAYEVFKKREKMLEESGLDINSCLQFLVDLYSQWLNNEVQLMLFFYIIVIIKFRNCLGKIQPQKIML